MSNTEFNIPEMCERKQCEKLLNALVELGALSTSDCREILGLMHPAGRVADLRASGHLIKTELQWLADESGRRHKQALYSLVREADK